MKSTIYIAQEHIEVVGYTGQKGSVRINDYLFAELPERTMINGNITDGAVLVDLLTSLKIQKPKLFKEVTLVIDSNSLSVKEIPVPKLNRKQYLQIVKEELASNYNAQDEVLIDYTLMPKPDKKMVLLGLSANKNFISNYLDVFNEAGIKICAIRVGLETIISYVKARPDLKDRTFVVNIVDGISMLSVVFSNGQNVFSTRARLSFESGLGRVQSVADNLSPLIQFMKSQKLPDIEKSYYLGLTEDQLEKLKLHGENFAGFDLLGGVKKSERIDNLCHLSFMGIFNNGMDLLESYKNIKKNMKEQKQVSGLWLLPALAVVILVAAYITPTLLTRSLMEDINVIEQYLNAPDTVEKIQRIDEVSAENARMTSVIEQIQTAQEEGARLGRLTNELINLITRTEQSVIIENFRLNDQGVITIVGSSDTEFDSSKYAEMLNSSELIGSVGYTGYQYDNNGRYRFSLQVELA